MNATDTAALDPTNLQGNLAGFNKDHQRFVFLHFPDKEKAQAFLLAIAGDIATCAEVQAFNALFKQIRSRRGCDDSGTVEATWLNLAISFAGLTILEAPELDSLPEDFKAGMRARAEVIGDKDQSAPTGEASAWMEPFKDGQVHAIAILAADDLDDLNEETEHLRRHISESGSQELTAIDGNTRESEGERGHEHFGFKDGISQPTIEGITSPAKPGEDVIPPGEFIVGRTGLDQAAPPAPSNGYNPEQPPSPPGPPAWTVDGSYLVFRRLRQDVQGFNDFIAKEAGEHGLSEALLGAKLVGRYKSGCPLERTRDQAANFDPELDDPATADPAMLDDEKIDNFDYDQDPDGKLVPRAAHIRKTNPRSSPEVGKEESNRHRILRRGIPYGPEFAPGEAPYGGGVVPDTQDRGLLFLCYQSSIARGFEFVQGQWANQENFPVNEDGRDPIISQDVAEPRFTLPREPEDLRLTLARWVVTTGGEYFFSPSLAAVRQLSGQLS